MRALFDIVHPAHVHFYRHLIAALEARGHATAVVARDTDVTTELLDAFGIRHTVVAGSGAQPGLATLGAELIRRDIALARAARRFRADVILTRNPAGVHAARLSGATGIFDTDDGREVGLLYRAAAPFAHVITAPDCITDRLGRRHVSYPSYKPLAFLHPERFQPDPAVRDELGVAAGERYCLVRLVAFASSHDRRDRGLSVGLTMHLIERLERHLRVFVSSEGPVPAPLAQYVTPVAPHRMHDVLALASLCATDGQSMAGEAAVLGVPSVRFTTTAGRIAVFRELRDRYGLVAEFSPGEEDAFLDAVERLAGDGDPDQWRARRNRLLEDKCDLTAWMLEHLDRLRPVAASG